MYIKGEFRKGYRTLPDNVPPFNVVLYNGEPEEVDEPEDRVFIFLAEYASLIVLLQVKTGEVFQFDQVHLRWYKYKRVT